MRILSRRNPLHWLFKATFGLDDAAPIASPLLCDKGSLTVTDTEDKLSISGGQLVCAGGKGTPAFGDPGVWSIVTYARQASRALLCNLTRTGGSGDKKFMVGFDSDATDWPDCHAIQLLQTVLTVYEDAVGVTVGSVADSTQYELAIVQRSAGALYIVDNKLVWVGGDNAVGNMYLTISNKDAAWVAPNLRVIDLGGAWGSDYGIARAYVASPAAITPTLGGEKVLNGGFPTDLTSWNTTDTGTDGTWAVATGVANLDAGAVNTNFNDGLTQAVAVDIGSWYSANIKLARAASQTSVEMFWLGGSLGVKYLAKGVANGGADTLTGTLTAYPAAFRATADENITAYIRTKTAAGMMECDDVILKPIALSSTLGTIHDHHADYLAEVGVTLPFVGVQGGLALNVDDETNPANGIFVYVDGTNLIMSKLVAGTWTDLISTAVTYGAGKRLVVIKDGASVTAYYNDAKVGTTQTINDATVKDNTKHSWFSTFSGNSFERFVLWPRTVTLPSGIG